MNGKHRRCPYCKISFETAKRRGRHIVRCAQNPRNSLPWWTGHIGDALIAALRERDGSDCALCAWPIDYHAKRGRDDHAVSVDHIRERAKGGSDAWSNLRLAHKLCNELRSAFPSREELITSAQWQRRIEPFVAHLVPREAAFA